MEKFFYQDSPEKYWDFETLKNPPAFQDDHDPLSACDGLRSITFDGVTENGKRTRTFAYIALPEGKMPAGGWPGILLVHGGGGTAFAWAAKLWASYGFAVLAPDWYGRRPVNADIANGSGELARPYLAGERTHSPEDTPAHITNVANLVLASSLLHSLPEVNPENTAYVGLSWGSWYGAMLTAVDPRFKGVVEIYLGDKKDNELFINGRFLHAAKNKMYYVVGTNDTHGFPATMQAGFEACGKMLGNRTMIVELPHSHVGFRFQACRRYAEHLLKNAPGLPLLGKSTVADGTISCEVPDEGKGIKQTFIAFTCDRDEAEPPKRKWQMLPAEYSNKVISAKLPENVYQCFLAAYDEDDLSTYCCGTGDVITF